AEPAFVVAHSQHHADILDGEPHGLQEPGLLGELGLDGVAVGAPPGSPPLQGPDEFEVHHAPRFFELRLPLPGFEPAGLADESRGVPNAAPSGPAGLDRFRTVAAGALADRVDVDMLAHPQRADPGRDAVEAAV